MALVTSPAAAFAGQASDPFAVTLTVNKKCVVLAGPMNFGTVNEVTGTETATSNVRVRCSKTTPFTLSLAAASVVTTEAGLLNGVTPGNTDKVPYNLVLSGSSGTGAGLRNANTIFFTILGSLTATPVLQPDVYRRTRRVYVTY